MKRNKSRRRESYDDKPVETPAAAPGRARTRQWSEADPEAANEAQRYAHPLPSRTHIQRTVAESKKPPTLDELIAAFELKKLNEQEALAKRLVAMTREGQLSMDRFGAYLAPADLQRDNDGEAAAGAKHAAVRDAPRRAPSAPVAGPRQHARGDSAPPSADAVGTLDGKVSAHRDGYGFLAVDGGGADVFLPPPQMRGLIDGDRARVRVTSEDLKGRREGALVEVLERGTRQWVGRFQASGARGGLFTVIPSSPKLPEVIVPAADRGGAQGGQMVLVELTSPINERGDRSLPLGRVVEVLGEHLAPGMEIQAAIRTHNLPYEWPEGVEAEAAAYGATVTPKQIEGRVDLRKLGLVTIDGADARDFDDAVCAEPVRGWRGGGWKLWVAIADVSAYVQPGTALDVEATNRGTSVYFPDNVIPMLPEALSNGLCSLNPDVDRLCMVCEMRVTSEGAVDKAQFYQAVMRSKARLIYDDVAEMIEHPKSKKAQAQAELLPTLQTLKAVFEALFAAREQRGAIDFEGTETKIVFGTGRKIEKIVPVKRNLAHRLIEECMIAANVEAAKLVDKHKMPALYRVHESPDADKVALLREFLAGRALRLPGGAVPAAADYSSAIAQLKGREDAGLVQNVMLRSLMQAKYSPDNIGHFGLALTHYAHFTSPIRRYPDLLLHRAIKQVLAHRKPKDFEYTPQQMELLGAHCSTTERRADDATRDVSTWLKCEFMSHRVGDEFAGVVTSVASFGLFVELEDLFIDGLIHVSNLVGDYYEFDARHQRLVGQRTKRVYALGERLRVRVMRVSLDERKIDLEAVAALQAGGGDRRGKTVAPKKGEGNRQGNREGRAAKAPGGVRSPGQAKPGAPQSGQAKPGRGRRGGRR